MHPKESNNGFTLIEMAMVLVIIGLLLGGILGPLSTQMDIKRYKETSKLLTEVSDALTGFAIVNQRLPCPDETGDGIEDLSACNIEGDLPWVSLGLGQSDAWGRPIRYRSDIAFNTAPIPDPPNAVSALSVVDLNNAALTSVGVDSPVAIIFSCGKNGFPENENDANGAVNVDAVCSNPDAATANAIYIQDIYVENQFDDTLIWISKNSLISRMAAAGQWP